jgi:hypothetical protein
MVERPPPIKGPSRSGSQRGQRKVVGSSPMLFDTSEKFGQASGLDSLVHLFLLSSSWPLPLAQEAGSSYVEFGAFGSAASEDSDFADMEKFPRD